MSLTNPSQVLLRNIDALNAQTPLFINMPADDFFADYIKESPNASPTSLHTHYAEFQYINSHFTNTVECLFTSHYQTSNRHDLVVISFPKSKAEFKFMLAMVTPFLLNDAQILIVGDNKSGIKSCHKLTGSWLTQCNKIDSARHCSLFSGAFNNTCTAFNITDWLNTYQITLNNITLDVASLPGVFSQDALDIGSKLLLENLPSNLSGKVLDFGCGAGVLSCFIGKSFPNCQLSLLDVSALALYSAEKTLEINKIKGEVFPSNSLSNVNGKYNHIISNPPFHQGVKTNYKATESFLENIKPYILPKGSITIVANSFLRYQEIMAKTIGSTSIVNKANGFSIYNCQT